MKSMIHKSKTNNAWYVVYVRSKHEKTVYKRLQNKGIESSLPLKTFYRKWIDRRKKVQLPIFRGYVFVRIDIQKERFNVLQTDGVVKFITFGNRIYSIPEVQMFWLDRLLTTSYVEYEQEFPLGVDVEVTDGPFKGLCGKVQEQKTGTRVVVWLDAIMQGVSLDIDPVYLKGRKQNRLPSLTPSV